MGETAAVGLLRARALAGLTALAAVSAGVLALAAPPLVPPAHTATYPSLPDLLALVCSGVLLVAWAWFALCVATCLADSLTAATPRRGADLRPWLRPAAARRVAALVVGSGLGGLVGAPAAAPALPSPDPPALVPAVAAANTPLPLPARPLGAGAARDRRAVVVRTGDTLWSLAAAHLIPARAGSRGLADASAVDAGWRRLYAANRAVLGPDPHLIHPGTRLDLPARTPTEGTP